MPTLKNLPRFVRNLMPLLTALTAATLLATPPQSDESITWIIDNPVDPDYSETAPASAPLHFPTLLPATLGIAGTKTTLMNSDYWSQQTSGTTLNLYGVGANAELAVAVGASGKIITSADNGITWTSRSSGDSSMLMNLCGDSSTWVAVGDAGTLLTSANGTTWTKRTTGTTVMLRAVAYGNGIHVAGGNNGVIIRSTDGATTWTTVNSGTSSTIQGIHYANGLFVAVGADSILLTSPDGQSWTSRTSNAGGWLLDVTYGNGTYVAVGLGGRIITSTNGGTWVRRTTGVPPATAHLYRITYAHGYFTAVGENGVIWMSQDGASWSSEPANTTVFLRGITATETGYLAVGYSGTILTKKVISDEEPPELPLDVTPANQPSGSLNDIVVYTSAGHGIAWHSTYGWIFGRGLGHGVVEDIGNIDQLNYFAEYCFKAGATVVPMRPLGNQPLEVVLDNVSTRVTWSGTWYNSSSTVYYGNAGEVPYRYAYINTASTTAWARYTPVIPATGLYPIYAWTRAGSDRVRQLYTITHSGGTTNVRVNHRRVGQGWVWLGTYHFNAGSQGSVQISNHAPGEDPSSRIVVADAIRFGNGMGDVNRGGSLSQLERELEASRYWVQRMTGQGMSSTLYDNPSLNDSDDNIGAPARMAAEMNRESDGGFWDRIYLGFHSNASTGTARGPLGLWDTRGTAAKQELQKVYGKLVADILHANMQYGQNGVLFPDGYANNTANLYGSGYGELYGTVNNEMNTTIIEVAFHDNSEDAKLLKCPAARRILGMSSYQAIVKHLSDNNPAVGTTLLPAPLPI